MTLSRNTIVVGVLCAIILLVVVGRLMPESGGAQSEAKRQELLDPFSAVLAPETDEIMTSDDVMRDYVRTYGLVPTMDAIISAAARTNRDCHLRAHQFGRMSYEELGDEVLKLNLPECHSGYYHGAIEAYFKKNGTADLQAKLPQICPNTLNFFFDHQCLHGLGHGLMAWSNYDLPATLEYCNLLPAEGTDRNSCRTGVFMENLIGSLNDSPEAKEIGHFTKYVSEDPQYPCDIVKDEYKSDCYFLQTDRMYALSKTGWQGVVDGCLKAPATSQYSCFGSMGRTVSGNNRGQHDKTLAACLLAPAGQLRDACIDGVAKDTFWDKAGQSVGLSFCAMVSADDKDVCYGALELQASGVLNAQDYQDFCGKVPTEFQEGCRSKTPAA